MSDTGSETQVAQQPPKLESHAVVDNGANGERLFAAQVAGLPTQAQIEATMANFQADQDAAFQARQVRERLVSAAATEPKISTAMAEGRANLDMMQHSDPAQAAEVQRLSDALKVRTGEHATGQDVPTIMLKPTLRQRAAAFGSSILSAFGLGKKETA